MSPDPSGESRRRRDYVHHRGQRRLDSARSGVRRLRSDPVLMGRASAHSASAESLDSDEVGGHRAAKRALELIEQVAASTEPIALSELARRLDMPKSSAHALTRTLSDEGYLARDARGAYSLGPRLMSLLGQLPSQYELPRLARPIMRHLVDATGETALLGVRHGAGIVYIEQVESPQFVRYVAPLGERRSLHCTSIGKIYLARLPAKEANDFLRSRKLQALTSHTKRDVDELVRELEIVRLQGYAINDQESVEGVTAVAVPVHEGGTGDGVLVAGLSVVGPSDRMQAKVADMPKPLFVAAERIGAGIKTR